AFALFRAGVENDANYTREVAAAVEREWRATTDRPLRLLGGPFALVSSVVMYLPDRPSTYADFSPYLSPWASAERMARDGLAIVCPRAETGCLSFLDALAARAAGARR